MNSSIDLAYNSRLSAVKMASVAKASHIGSSLSLIDILAVLYADILSITENIETSDSIIVSKGHAAAGIYAVLAHAGLIPLVLLESYGQDGSTLGGHITHSGNPRIELSTGSLGHGIPYGLGIALAQKKMGSSFRTFVVVSDGECDEGTTWESALMANQFQLRNLTVIIDRNRIQSLSGTENTIALEPLAEKWNAFKWKVITVNGHSHSELKEALNEKNGPICIIAETIKGKGVSFMENEVLWHYRPPNEDELKAALNEIKANK